MAEVKVYYDQLGNTLTVWFGNPNEEYICEDNSATPSPSGLAILMKSIFVKKQAMK